MSNTDSVNSLPQPDAPRNMPKMPNICVACNRAITPDEGVYSDPAGVFCKVCFPSQRCHVCNATMRDPPDWAVLAEKTCGTVEELETVFLEEGADPQDLMGFSCDRCHQCIHMACFYRYFGNPELGSHCGGDSDETDAELSS